MSSLITQNNVNYYKQHNYMKVVASENIANFS